MSRCVSLCCKKRRKISVREKWRLELHVVSLAGWLEMVWMLSVQSVKIMLVGLKMKMAVDGTKREDLVG